MSETVIHIERRSAPSTLRDDLRARIGWICHALRIAAVVWIGWETVRTLAGWSNKARTLEGYGYWFMADFSRVSDARYAAAAVAALLSLAASVPVVVCVWRLAGTYLAGRVFSVEAALWLHRIGSAGAAAVGTSILARAVAASIIAGEPVFIPPRGSFVFPQDLLHLIFVAFVLALAHIFKAAAEMAEDHAQIV
jgi:hypothetical protein